MWTKNPILILCMGAALGIAAACGGSGGSSVEEHAATMEEQSETAGETAGEAAESAREEVRETAAGAEQAARPAELSGGAGRSTKSAGSSAPVPPPAPEPRVVTVPAGTPLTVAFLDSLSSGESRPGDSFRVRVLEDVVHDGQVVIPAGSVVVGTVREVQSLTKKIGGRAKLVLDFESLELPSGRTATVRASLEELGKSETKRDAATIGGATAGGALLGRILDKGDKDKGTLIGAVVGAAAGTAIAAKSQGQEVVIEAGTEVRLVLDEPAHVPVIP